MKLAARLSRGALVSLLLVAACAPSGAPSDDAESVTDDATAAGTPKRVASSGALTLTVYEKAAFETRDGKRVLVLDATASRDLYDVHSWVPDDAFGRIEMVTLRKFEIILETGHELNTIASGLPLFIDIHTVKGTPDHYTAKLDLGVRLARFTGSNEVWLGAQVRPVWASDGVDYLRYRGTAHTDEAASLTAFANDGAPLVAALTPIDFQFDWKYPELQLAADPPSEKVSFKATFEAGGTATKKAGLDLYASGLALTSEDPWEAFPTKCDLDVYACVQAGEANGATDFGHCGTYREVSRCMYTDGGCDLYDPEPLSLSQIDSSPLAAPAAAWDAACVSGYSWCSMTAPVAYEVPQCIDGGATMAQVLEQLALIDQNHPGQGWDGVVHDRDALATSTHFAAFWSPEGPALLQAIDAFVGDDISNGEPGTPGYVQGAVLSEQISCHNCTEAHDRTVLYYPSEARVIVLDGTHGYDS
ncbi:MAG: hypothetical protein WKG00_18715 [Polyangiaceae bacterium]